LTKEDALESAVAVPPEEGPLGESPTPPPSLNRLKAGLLSTDELKRFRFPDEAKTTRDIALIWVQVACGVAIYLSSPGVLTYIVAALLIGGAQHGMTHVMHEAAHFTLYPSSKKRNDFVGSYFFSFPVGIPLLLFRYRHFVHHRTYSTMQDTKTVYRHDVRGLKLFVEIIRSLSGYEYAVHALEVFGRDKADADTNQTAAPSALSLIGPLFIVHGVLFLAFSLVSPWLYFTLWLIPNFTVHNLCDKFRAMMEHQPLEADWDVDPEGPYFRGTDGPFVRSVRASLLERLFLCKINFGFHAEHHLWPQVSYQHLPAVREKLVAADAFSDPRIGLEDTYLSAIAKMWHPEPGEGAIS
jgi:fatty acid desaturase